MRKIIPLLIFVLSVTSLSAHTDPKIDTLVAVDQISVSTIKQGLNINAQPVSASILTRAEVERKGISAIKEASQIVPNLHIPDYGSRTTSSIYIRGLGARIDQPVMGLNIDNVPYLNKNAFDTEVMDIERIEVLRGPQSTLYGRNTMGGVMNIYTLSPFNYQGLRLGAEYSSGNTYKFRVSLYSLHSEKFASAVSLYYNSTDGFFENAYSGELCDWEKSYGGRVKLAFKASDRLRIENTAAVSLIDQGGYAYKQIDSEQVNYNVPASYDRLSVSNGTTVKYHGDNYSLASITSYQYLDDDMFFDNDFTVDDYFTLRQAVREHSVTEDVVYRSERASSYNFLFGAFGFYKRQFLSAPVTFRQYGIDELILNNANKYMDPYYFVWDEDEFALNSDFMNKTYGVALYHESTFERGAWRVTAGMRADYEKASLQYHNYCQTGSKLYDKNDKLFLDIPVEIDNRATAPLSYFELLPKVNVQYRMGEYGQSSLYAAISKGYKAGGFNTQIFSDILQVQVMEIFGIKNNSPYDTEEIITYKPEHSWNYEIGAHLTTPERTSSANIALFYIDCQDQQLTVFPAGQSTGRMMTNAGGSRSYGVEVDAKSNIADRLTLSTSYGYTNAKFTEYVSGNSDYAGNYVPYAPQHTFFAEMDYTAPLNVAWADSICFSFNNSGAGRIYWNEENSQWQDFYSLLGSSIRVENKNYAVTLWMKNILDRDYNTFYFKSMEREFVQCGRPRTIGVTLSINL